MVGILVALSFFMWLRSRMRPINPENVNNAWDDQPAAKTPASAKTSTNPKTPTNA
jgi:hypothetical protein